jgi:F0F1-type ATP synthase delta subunit
MELLGLGVLLVFALVTVIFLTRGVFSRDLTRALKRVNQQEQALQEKADVLEQRLSQMERDYQAKLKRGDAEAERLIEEAKQQAVNIRTAAIEEAKHRARQLLLEAGQDRAQLRLELAREMDGKIVQRACESLQRLLPPQELSALHGSLTRELLEALARIDAAPLRQQGVERVEVRTAQPLPAEASQRLSAWAAASLGAGVPVHVETDPALVAGCIVRIGPTIVDNSLASRLNTP